jgi:hypothetical protein
MKLRLPGAVLLFLLCAALIPPDFGSVVAAAIESPTCELIRPGTYFLPPSAFPS